MAFPLYNDYLVYDSGQSAYWDTQTLNTGATKVAVDPGVLRGSVVQVTFSRTQSVGVREDLAMFDLHLTVTAGAHVYTTLTDTDAGLVEGLLDTMWTTLKPSFSPHIVASGYVWRHWGADYPLGTTGLSKPSPTWRSTTRSVAGTSAANPLPDQVAESITFITASRRHWGRIYLPPLASSLTTSDGRLSNGNTDSTVAPFHTFINAANALTRQVDVLVWSPKHRGAFGVSKLQMDSTFDVIRSRRAKQTTYRKVYTS